MFMVSLMNFHIWVEYKRLLSKLGRPDADAAADFLCSADLKSHYLHESLKLSEDYSECRIPDSGCLQAWPRVFTRRQNNKREASPPGSSKPGSKWIILSRRYTMPEKPYGLSTHLAEFLARKLERYRY